MIKTKKVFVKGLLLLAKILHSKSYMKLYNKYLEICGVDIKGTVKYIHSSVYIDTAYANHIHIGDNSVISVNSILLAHDFSVECGLNSIGLGDLQNEKSIVKDVYIGKNVFIGCGCVILPGTQIGDNCVIGAGTVCSGKIPENSIVVGEKWKVIANTTDWAKEKLDEYGALWGTR